MTKSPALAGLFRQSERIQDVLIRLESFQTVEKVQRELGFLSYMWYNVNGDENVGRKEKF